jgi:hypothetical protein
MKYTNNFLNLIPIVTFAIAVMLGLEKLSLGNWPGRMKVVGTVMCVGGTMMVSLLKGRLLHLWPTTHLLMSSHPQQQQQAPPPNYPHHQEKAWSPAHCSCAAAA